jgi:two-component system nitrogen regulation response regulator GlnG
VIAATNRNLEQAIEDKQFRSDLFYRLNVYTIHLPPLCERGDDIRLLANHFIRRFANELGKPLTGIAPEAMDQLMSYRWPGNVRELQSVIKHALLEATGPVIVPAFLPDFLRATSTSSRSTEPNTLRQEFAKLTSERLQAGSHDIHRELVSLAERQIFAEVLEYTDGNLTQAAKRLGITRTTLRARLEALGMSVERSATLEQR